MKKNEKKLKLNQTNWRIKKLSIFVRQETQKGNDTNSSPKLIHHSGNETILTHYMQFVAMKINFSHGNGIFLTKKRSDKGKWNSIQ